MIETRITISGNGDISPEIAQFVTDLANNIPIQFRKAVDSQKPSGRRYPRKKVGRGKRAGQRFHTASAPGQFPAKDTGELYRKISVTGRGRFAKSVRFNAPHAGHVENIRPYLDETIIRTIEATNL